MSSIGTLGDLGEASDAALLDGLRSDGDSSVRRVAENASTRLTRRLEKTGEARGREPLPAVASGPPSGPRPQRSELEALLALGRPLSIAEQRRVLAAVAVRATPVATRAKAVRLLAVQTPRLEVLGEVLLKTFADAGESVEWRRTCAELLAVVYERDAVQGRIAEALMSARSDAGVGEAAAKSLVYLARQDSRIAEQIAAESGVRDEEPPGYSAGDR
jgi:hypothetical protein